MFSNKFNSLKTQIKQAPTKRVKQTRINSSYEFLIFFPLNICDFIYLNLILSLFLTLFWRKFKHKLMKHQKNIHYHQSILTSYRLNWSSNFSRILCFFSLWQSTALRPWLRVKKQYLQRSLSMDLCFVPACAS